MQIVIRCHHHPHMLYCQAPTAVPTRRSKLARPHNLPRQAGEHKQVADRENCRSTRYLDRPSLLPIEYYQTDTGEASELARGDLFRTEKPLKLVSKIGQDQIKSELVGTAPHAKLLTTSKYSSQFEPVSQYQRAV